MNVWGPEDSVGATCAHLLVGACETLAGFVEFEQQHPNHGPVVASLLAGCSQC